VSSKAIRLDEILQDWFNAQENHPWGTEWLANTGFLVVPIKSEAEHNDPEQFIHQKQENAFANFPK
tara:strand:+ start:286 stop:483 length:198 start_codon:yes stop_codon:yes gene_type:complete